MTDAARYADAAALAALALAALAFRFAVFALALALAIMLTGCSRVHYAAPVDGGHDDGEADGGTGTVCDPPNPAYPEQCRWGADEPPLCTIVACNDAGQ